MMMNIRKKRLAITVAGAVGLVVSTAQAGEFGVSTTLQNSLTVTKVTDFNLDTVFATAAAKVNTEGVGALVIGADGSVESSGTSGISLISLGTPVPAQGSVDMASEFTLTFPTTTSIVSADFSADNATPTLGNIVSAGIPLTHESANPAVAKLYLMHFTIESVSGGGEEVGAENTTEGLGDFVIVPDFGETTYVFNIGATLTTEPGPTTAAAEGKVYQVGTYAGTFEVLAAY